jgi:23S rRNA (cytidine1920-2'-O)/16S rRNA (cytidine1409-2'-O)-methyltransferase
MKQRLDQLLVDRNLCQSRSQAENFIRLKKVAVNGKLATKPGLFVASDAKIEFDSEQRYVSRAGLKLASVAEILSLDFKHKVVLDVGSSTGGFTDYALQHGAQKVIAVDVGTNQLHPRLRDNPAIELHEKTDIRDFATTEAIDVVVIDVSFISLRQILPAILQLAPQALVIAMAKPQFEAGKDQVNKGIIKNEKIRRQILTDFEAWVKNYFVIQDKRDSEVTGSKGNRERFYVLLPGVKAK